MRTPYSREFRLKAFVVVSVGILLAVLLPEGTVGHPAYAQEVDSSFEYPENGTSMVGWFRAYDQDGGTIEWSLSGPDDDLFTIDGGELRFKEPPDYEDPKAVAGNDYRVTVEASGGTHDVAVTVVDVDEAGTVNIDRRQPQVDRPLGAALLDEDAGVTGERWQWARSEDGTAWTNIQRATSPRRSPVPADVGTYLRATVTYSDRFGSGKTAWAVSAHRVEARTLSNAAPSFADQDQDRDTTYIDITRSVAENTAVGVHVGRAVLAIDADNDVLFYEFVNTPDLRDDDGTARFTIDSMSGQIRVGKELGADEGEREDEDSTSLTGGPALPDSEDADDPDNSEYVLRVKVWDPSTASATVNVIVRVTGVNEAPRFDSDPPTELSVTEGDASKRLQAGTPLADLQGNTYMVEDEDAEDEVPQTGAYSLEGADRDSFSISDAGALSVAAAHTPNFEEQSSYSITIIGRSGAGSRRLMAALDVTIDVVDAEDVGEVSLSQREPQVGRVIRAAISDPDGGVSVTGWEWERSDEITVDEEGTPSARCRQAEAERRGIPAAGGWTPIDGVSTLEYTPTPVDMGRCLRATATYRDRIGPTTDEAKGVTEAPVQNSKLVNTAPEFVDQDLSSTGDQSHRTSRRVAENTEAGRSIGAPVTAHDDDGELLVYSLGGADAEFFGIDRNNGQLKTKAPLNYEARTSYRVNVIATDPSGASDTILVTINVTDVGDPVRITGIRSASFAENRSTPVTTFNAYGEEGSAIRWSLSGPDDERFTVARGVLRFREPPDYENPKSASAGNVYRVTIEADGGTRNVTVTVTDVDEVGTVHIDRPQPQVDRPLGATLLDEDAGVSDVRWQWARSEDGRIWTDIDGVALPRLTPTPDDVGRYLRASVTYSDRFGSGKTASAVSARRVEARTLANAAPSFADQDEDENTAYIDITRSIPENTPEGTVLGEPLSAKDADGDLLFYELLNTPDLEDEDGDARFTIDSLSGQIRVGKSLEADRGQREDEDSTALVDGPALPQGDDADNAANSEYVLRVMVSDPSTASATVNVVVTVTEVNEPPLFDEDAPTVLRVRENTVPPVLTFGYSDTPVSAATFAVTDQDGSVTGPGGYDDTAYAYSVSGTDRNVFAISSDGTLSFRASHRPDFEKKSSYSISIAASSGVGSRRLTTSLNLTINVVDAEDAGTVVLSQRQPQVGVQIHAMASDPDGDVTITRWLWELSGQSPLAGCRNVGAGDEFWDPIPGASSSVYVPKPSDVGRCLRATATYRDGIGNSAFESATGVLEAPVRGGTPDDTTPNPEGGFVNAAPVFPDQDFLTEGDQSDRTTREVAENTKSGQNIGAPVSAHDDDGDLLIYTLGGADAAHFSISRNDGQLKTKGALNYEARNSYTVVVTATDPSGAADSITVTINVTDVDDPTVITILDD